MSLLVRQADLQADYPGLIATLQTNLPHLPHVQFFDWLYRRNPAGQALVWVATDHTGEQILGMAAAFPRHLYGADGADWTGYVLGDFCIAPEHRSLGAALMLQRACLRTLADNGARFALDFPSEGMMAVYKRMRIGVTQKMTRHAKPLRADQKIAARVGVPFLARGLAAIANLALRLRDSGERRRTDCTVSVEPGPWGAEFSRAARDWSPRMGYCVARTADFLNWRYGEHPSRRYEMLQARRRGKLEGFLVQHTEGGSCTIADLMGNDDAVLHDLLAHSTALARDRGLDTLSAPCLSSHSAANLMRKCGFQERESCPVLLLSWPPLEDRPNPHGAGWYVSFGDWET